MSTAATAEGRPCREVEGHLSVQPLVASSSPEKNPRPVEIVPGPNFAFVKDSHSWAQAACAPLNLAHTLLLKLILDAERAFEPTDAARHDLEIAIVLTTGPVSCSDIYYLPIANDVQGIGYARIHGVETFDDSPDSALQGIAFLNDWPYWRDHPDEFRSAFNHEVGHRWGARVHARLDGVNSAVLLGRQRQHWSFFIDSAASPLEGNVWVPRSETEFETATPRHGSVFSALDRYLMGILPADAVPPFLWLEEPVITDLDCRGNAIGPYSPPQSCEPIEVSATPRWVTIEDVIAAEGPRVPAFPEAPTRVNAAVFVLETANAPLTPELCRALAHVIDQRFNDFSLATDGGLELNNLLRSAASCDRFTSTPDSPLRRVSGGGCNVVPGRAFQVSPGLGLSLLWFALLYRVHLLLRYQPIPNAKVNSVG